MLIAGVLLLVGGVVGFVAAAPKMDEMRSGLGQLASAFDAGTSSQFQAWQLVYYLAIGAMVAGAVLAVVGAIQSSRKKAAGGTSTKG